MSLLEKKKFYFIGIGGIGMSGIAEILHEMKFKVSGSDMLRNPNTIRLKKMGININFGHTSNDITNFDLVVISSAIKKNNSELIRAIKHKIPVLPRAKMLAEILRLKSSVTIAGSHGKTTTTSLVSCILEQAKLDPTVINGGIINNYKTNAKLGKGDWIIAEADESDGSFTYLPSTICLINNIDPEHLDFYGTFEKLKKAFIEYADNIPFYGFISICADHKNLKALIKKMTNKKVITFGLSKNAGISAKNIEVIEKNEVFYTKFDLIINIKKPDEVNNIIVPILGDHNLRNTLGAISIGLNLGVKKNQIKNALRDFKGVKRRFTLVAKINKNKIFDDYAHHPKEISATLTALKQISKGKIIAIYEPHRFSRLKDLFSDFSSCFKKADFIFILPVFAAGEKKIKGFDSKKLVMEIRKRKKKEVYLAGSEKSLFFEIKDKIQPNDNIIFLGAGPITKLANSLPMFLKSK